MSDTISFKEIMISEVYWTQKILLELCPITEWQDHPRFFQKILKNILLPAEKNPILSLLPSSLSQTCRYHLERSPVSVWLDDGNVEKTDLQPSPGLVQSNHKFSLSEIFVSVMRLSSAILYLTVSKLWSALLIHHGL